MNWVSLNKMKEINFIPPTQQPHLILSPPPPPNLESHDFNWSNKVSPSILLIIIILAIIFFVSGLLHLLVRFLMRPRNRDPDEFDNVTALQGQLQQLFDLHDAGVDQSFIDTLPVFNYKSIIGVKNPFDCAVCLCEFEPDDKLRLLPKCSHAFHMDCIDTWLLSHSTCPLCRACLVSDFSPNNCSSPIVLVLESGSESSREIVSDRECVMGLGPTSSFTRPNSHMGFQFYENSGEIQRKSCEIQPKELGNEGKEEKVVAVKLGKFKNVDNNVGGEGSSSISTDDNVNARRCFSMGSFEYVMDENSLLKVPIRTPMKKQSSKKPSLPLTPGHKPAMSECGCDSMSRREFNGFEEITSVGSNAIGRSKRESFSISKIWLRGKKERPNLAAGDSQESRRAFSFRFPLQRSGFSGEVKAKNGGGGGVGGDGVRRAKSEIEFGRWENEEENQSCNSLDSRETQPSFARRTLLWLMGRQNKVVHSSFSTNV